MDVGTLLAAAQTFFAAFQSAPQLTNLSSIFQYKSHLDNLKSTLDTVNAALEDAESMQDQGPLLSQARLYMDQLMDVVYDADDLFDELVTLHELERLKKHGNASSLFSCFNSLGFASTMSQRVKEIRDRFNAIANSHHNFSFERFNLNFKLGYQPSRRRRDTCSYENIQDIIGREDDRENIVSRLLHPSVQRDVSCLTIVGMGGLGKTTLAQQVYNDPRIEKEFPLRVWTCVSDDNQGDLDERAILCKIWLLITHGDQKDLEFDDLQKRLREQLARNKFLLVLDDVWNEDKLRWQDLEKFLKNGPRGSWILVTTRSEKTAEAVGDEHPYILKGLSDEDSWRLFKIMAFGQTDEQPCSPSIEEIGRGIVKRCANIPLAIRVVGSLLNGHGEEKWISFQNIGLGRLKIGKHGGGIEPILKLSYLQLEPPLKKCFSYCAIFPKDHEIKKEMLINLWMAQDYIVPPLEGQSIEEASEEYFSALVKRCFFQDIKKDEYGNIVSCKIHDLMHDIAQEVAWKVHTANSTTVIVDNNIRHFSIVYSKSSIRKPYIKAKIRTLIFLGNIWGLDISVGRLLRNWMCLRTLDLSNLGRKSLPSALGNLLHLRYLDLSRNNRLKMLPKSITKLLNLQTLHLRRCIQLKGLPRDLRNLVKLRVLDIAECHKLNNMPQGMGTLSRLQKLPMFVVGSRNSGLKHSIVDQLEELKALTNLKGGLHIFFRDFEYRQSRVRDGGYIKNKKHLDCVHIEFNRGGMRPECHELLMDDLEPNHNLKELKLSDYKGRRFPSWTREDDLATVGPNLVHIQLSGCWHLQQLPTLRKLLHLKSLTLERMDELEYVESRKSTTNNGGASGYYSDTFFPSLEQLTLESLPKLKGWWRDDDIIHTKDRLQSHLLPSFPCISKLSIIECPELTSIPGCPTLEELELDQDPVVTARELSSKVRIMNDIEPGSSKLRMVRTCNSKHLKSAFPMEAFRCLRVMNIAWDDDVESLSEIEDVFRSCSSSLQRLSIQSCCSLKSVWRGGLEHLTALEDLTLSHLRNLNLGEGEGDEEDVLPHTLLSLQFEGLPKMVNIPKGIRNLTALQSLSIQRCEKLQSVPESMRELTSLTTLQIQYCSDKIFRRCQENTGEDWPNILHIPNRFIRP